MGILQNVMFMPETYTKLDLEKPTDYENDFEKQLLMGINLIRYNPKVYGTYAVKLTCENKLAKNLNKVNLLNYLQKCK